jgi:hypothetical protein
MRPLAKTADLDEPPLGPPPQPAATFRDAAQQGVCQSFRPPEGLHRDGHELVLAAEATARVVRTLVGVPTARRGTCRGSHRRCDGRCGRMHDRHVADDDARGQGDGDVTARHDAALRLTLVAGEPQVWFNNGVHTGMAMVLHQVIMRM